MTGGIYPLDVGERISRARSSIARTNDAMTSRFGFNATCVEKTEIEILSSYGRTNHHLNGSGRISHHGLVTVCPIPFKILFDTKENWPSGAYEIVRVQTNTITVHITLSQEPPNLINRREY